MASTSNKNSPGNYEKEQKMNKEKIIHQTILRNFEKSLSLNYVNK